MSHHPSDLDPVALIAALDPDAIRAELDRLYQREAALRAALKIARRRRPAASPRPRSSARKEVRHGR